MNIQQLIGIKPIVLVWSSMLALGGVVAAQEVSESEMATVIDVMSRFNSEVSDTADAMQEATVLASGSFTGVAEYQAEGQATLYRLADGSNVLRLENLDVTNGPDLHLILTSAATVNSSSDAFSEPAVDLGLLKGNQGNQNYTLPEGTDLSAITGVAINCNAFSALWGTAPLDQAAAAR